MYGSEGSDGVAKIVAKVTSADIGIIADPLTRLVCIKSSLLFFTRRVQVERKVNEETYPFGLWFVGAAEALNLSFPSLFSRTLAVLDTQRIGNKSLFFCGSA